MTITLYKNSNLLNCHQNQPLLQTHDFVLVPSPQLFPPFLEIC